ncbi:MBL fold metallo-hydrolase [Halocatena halophila]|uniref:MBL fold metallo-hydrolase n=1 Tax=Halocatena halophila TaxID=2814576 RepID=UPI0038B40839
MRVTFLGTGSALAGGDRVQTGLLIDGEDAGPLLVDCGAGVLQSLTQTAVGYAGIETVLLTHLHVDHVSDLFAILKARWLAGEPATEIVGPPGTESFLETMLSAYDYLREKLELSVREIGPSEFDCAGFRIDAVQTVHSITTYAYRLDDGECVLTISSDTEASDAVMDLADGSSLLIHDCSFPDSVDVANHPTPTQLGDVLAGHPIDTIVLTHLYPHTNGEHEAMRKAVGDAFDGDVLIAHDGMMLDV